MGGEWPHRSSIAVRYHECDMQQVVFNAHYLTYCDLAVGAWLAARFGRYDDHFDWMLVRAEIDWRGSATFGDTLDIDVGVERWGTTSFVVRFLGSVGERVVFEGRITYVCIRPGTKEKMAVPDDLRARLGMAPAPAA
jgi:acyl-CoA thioester hydrolase